MRNARRGAVLVLLAVTLAQVQAAEKIPPVVTKEAEGVRERYGRGSPKHLGDGAPMWNDQLLMARRLVEAGARCVTVAYGFWDTHGRNFQTLKNQLPLFDRGISALVEDIHAHGLDQDVTLVVWGEADRMFTPGYGKEYAAAIPGASFRLLPGAGHLPQLETPEAVLALFAEA